MATSGNDGSIVLTTQVDESGLKKSLGSMEKTAKKIGANTAKAFAAIGAAAGAATVAITKMAVSAYADYEQLVGGVETLFKGSADTVLKYANDAFRTTGQSANEYMSNVTAFSASLISSLGGDTEKAAEVANQAMISMADNANKMGTPMENVQSAFQGFAKGQYMLLDNLKLGYGGTKTEMERLLKDAQAITGVKYDISNLSDVYTAIGVIQEKLGIAGTTAKEAEKTISGSANMMKAAWQNVLAAISGGGDLDKAINNLVYSIQKYFENIVPVVQRALAGIGKLIEQVAPMLVQSLASTLIQAIPSLLNAIYQMIIGLAKGIMQGIQALFTGGSGSITAEIKTSISDIGSEASEASTGMKELGNATEKAGKQAKKSLAAFDDLQIISSGENGETEANIPTIAGDAGGVGNVSSEMSLSPSASGESPLAALDSILAPLQSSITGIGESLKGIFTSPEVLSSIQGFANTVGTTFGQVIGSIGSIGSTIATNLLGGFDLYLQENEPFIKERLSGIFDASSQMATSVGNMWTAFADIFSALADENGQTLTANIISIFSNAGLGIVELATKIGADFMNLLTQPITDNTESLKTALDGVLGVFSEISGDISSLVSDLFTDIIALYDEHIKPLVDTITETLSELVGKATEAFNTYILPVLEDFAEDFGVVVEEHIKPMFDKIFDFIGKVVDLIKSAIENVIKPMLGFLVEKLAPVIGEVIDVVGKVFNTLMATVSDVIGAIMDIFSGLIDFFTGIFTGDLEGAWEGLKTTFQGLFDGIESILKGALNIFIDAINGLISGINGAIDIINNIPGVSIPKISKIPRLAQGTVVPPNREFLAVLGDNKKEHEIVSPISTMKQAFMEAMVEMGGSTSGSNTIVLEIDGREFGRAVIEQGNRESRRIGTRLVTV